jgi:pantetheine-phosphate adenylyltransferase
MKDTLAIYPGSFDPITNGHLDLIERSSRIFGRLRVALLVNSEKKPLFTLEERIEMARQLTGGFANVTVDTFDGLLVDYAARSGAKVIVRGVRAFSDYEYEFQMALMNRKLAPDLETIFLMPAENCTYVSSKLVKEIVRYGGDVRSLVPSLVEKRLREKVSQTL